MKKVILSLSLFAIFGVLVTGCQPEASSDSAQMEQEKEVVVAHYVDYSAEKLEMRAGQNTILFFYAGWCPTCRKWEGELVAEILPENAMVLKANYDTEEELRRVYGVTTQSTAVLINADGTFELLRDPVMEKVQDFFMIK